VAPRFWQAVAGAALGYRQFMASVFTMIINGDLPGRFVWQDDRCVAFLSINPLAPGHTLVVPREEVDHWIDADVDLLGHLASVSSEIGAALQEAFSPVKVGMMIAGLEVPHLHIHLVPMNGVHDLDFANADPSPDPADLDAAAAAIRQALHQAGASGVSD
jgi:histidine triad (HIT) family protein